VTIASILNWCDDSIHFTMCKVLKSAALGKGSRFGKSVINANFEKIFL
jgi:hypothetical protein